MSCNKAVLAIRGDAVLMCIKPRSGARGLDLHQCAARIPAYLEQGRL